MQTLLESMLADMETMIQSRNIKSEQALRSALRECDTKWRSFASRANDVNPDGFKMLQHKLCPTSKFFLP